MSKTEINMLGDQELHPDGMTLVVLPKPNPEGVLRFFYALTNILPPSQAKNYNEAIADLEAEVQKGEQGR
jgi:hypothetical protein